MGIDAALNRVGEEIKLSCPELSDEIRLLTLEVRAGKSRQAALKDFAARINLEEVKGLVLTIDQSERFGTSVVQALKTYSDTFRTERFRRAEEQAGKIPIKLIFPLIFCLFPSVFVIMVAPPLIKIYLMFMRH
jgi:tight adherence protein C